MFPQIIHRFLIVCPYFFIKLSSTISIKAGTLGGFTFSFNQCKREVPREKFQKIELQTGAHVKVITVSLPAGVQNMTNEGLNQLYTTVS
jgi:hypothetical protein